MKMKEYSLYFLIKFLFLLTSINGYDRINDDSEEEGAVGGTEEVESMNIGANSLKPCNDFYSYVCNSKDENNQTLQEKLENEKTKEIESITTQAIGVLEEAAGGPRYAKLSMEKAWYKACTDKINSRQEGMRILTEILNENGGIRNINIEEELQEEKNWQAVASSYAKRFGESAFLKVSINQQNLISIQKPYQWDISKLSINAWVDKIDLFFDKFSFNGIKEDLIRTKRRLFTFIDAMQSVLKGHRRDILTTKQLRQRWSSTLKVSDAVRGIRDILTIEQLQERWSSINWNTVLQDIGLDLNSLDKVEIDTGYFNLLDNLLNNFEGGSIVNYIHLTYIMDNKVKIYWDTNLNNLNTFELSTLCFKHMPIKKAIFSIIEKSNFSDRKILIREVFENLRKVFIREVHKSWLVDNYKNEALENLKNVQLRITDMQHRLSPNMKVSYIFNIKFCSLENLINFNTAQMEYLSFVFRKNQHKLPFHLISRKKRDLTFKLTNDDNVNEIRIPVEELMTPFLNLYKPIAWNYGHVATKISYKLAEMLDDVLAKLPRNNALKKKHEEKANCFGKSFLKHKENALLNKYILAANSFALKMSYKALNNILNKTIRKNETLPTLHHLSGRQLFFTSFAAGDCQRSDSKDTINEAMRHSKGFAKAFKCPRNSFMNPVKKCEMWRSTSIVKRVKTSLQQILGKI